MIGHLSKQKNTAICYASLAEKTRTPPRNYSLVVFFYRDELFERLPPRGSCRRRRLRESALPKSSCKTKVPRAPSVTLRVPPSSRRKAFACHSSADSGFRLLPNGARTATRYACPRRERREIRKARKRNDREILPLVELSLCCGY